MGGVLKTPKMGFKVFLSPPQAKILGGYDRPLATTPPNWVNLRVHLKRIIDYW